MFCTVFSHAKPPRNIHAAREVTSGCPVPIFFYFLLFLSLFLFSPIFKLKPPIFPIFLAGEAKISNKIENGIIVVCVFECNLS